MGDRRGLEVLSRDECLCRLGSSGVGRVAGTVRALPFIFPVEYAVLDGEIVFRSRRRAKLTEAALNSIVAFEVDDANWFDHTGWNVLIIGPAREIADPATLARAADLPLGTWSADGTDVLVGIEARLVSGRDLTLFLPPDARAPAAESLEAFVASQERTGGAPAEGPAGGASVNGTSTATTRRSDNLVLLSVRECYELLATQPVGRLAVARRGAGPLVVPVNFRLDGETIVFRSDPGLKLDLLRAEAVSFEVDWVDWRHRTGWSVLVSGAAREAVKWEVDHLHLEAWAEGDKRTWVLISPTEVTGRRLVAAELYSDQDGRGYL